MDRLEHELISKEVAVIRVIGEIDISNHLELQKFAIGLLSKGHFWLVFDLVKLDFTSTDGLGVFVDIFQRARLHKGTANFVITDKRMIKKFAVTGLTKVFRIYSNVFDAVNSIYADSLSSGTPLDGGEFGWYWFPARIYTSEEDAGPAVEKALSQLIDTFGVEVVYGFSVERGSWFREFILRMKNSTALPTRDEALSLMQRALEQQILAMPQSRIDVAQSQAVAGLLVALEKTPNAVIQSGSVLLIKVKDVIVVRNLTQLELAHWERNPGLFRDPERALCELQRAWDPTSIVDDPQNTQSV